MKELINEVNPDLGKKISMLLEELKLIARHAVADGNFEKALAGVNAAADLLYQYNQIYTDKDLEDILLEIGRKEPLLKNLGENVCPVDSNVVVFYDRFGLDTRGWALCYIKAFAGLDYQVYYIVPSSAEGNQPEIDKAINNNIHKIYIDFSQGYFSSVKKLADVFVRYKPRSAFFYSTPDDVVGALVFDFLQGGVTRYQVDLTDHAYWLGVNAVDYCVDSRSLGAGIAVYNRGFKKEQIRILDGCAIVHDDIPFAGFNFSTEGKRIIFSGGAIYKTLGDADNTYYKMIDHILGVHKNIIFYYLGEGDQSELIELQKKYPDQVYFSAERKDFFEIMKRCVLYFNTYPMFGGLMMRYAAMAGKLPITLKHEHDADGILFHQNELDIEYDDVQTLLADVDRLLTDENYLREREKKMIGATILEDDFRRNLKTLIERQETEYSVPIEPVDTKKFRDEYIARFDYSKQREKCIAKRINKSLLGEYPLLFAKRFFKNAVHNFF